MVKTEFEVFLEKEIEKGKGVYFPATAGFLRRAFIKHLPCGTLHPNPQDEFCSPEIGPNYEIISRYEQDFRILKESQGYEYLKSAVCEPIEVERIHPDGYMILNGHHRWAAALRTDMKKLRVRIVDLTQEKDIRKMLSASRSDRRVTLDLDEVVFRPETDPFLEKPLRFPIRRIYKERLRRGIPGLFYLLNRLGYDIWVYTANNLSLDYLRYYFKHYHTHVDGIITGAARKMEDGSRLQEELSKAINAKYAVTVHVDNSTVVRTVRDGSTFDEFPLTDGGDGWVREVVKVFEEMQKNEQ